MWGGMWIVDVKRLREYFNKYSELLTIRYQIHSEWVANDKRLKRPYDFECNGNMKYALKFKPFNPIHHHHNNNPEYVNACTMHNNVIMIPFRSNGNRIKLNHTFHFMGSVTCIHIMDLPLDYKYFFFFLI